MKVPLLTRRLFFAASLSAVATPAWTTPKPFTARLFSAGFDGTAYRGGLHLTMDPGWKTYWRVPGEGGIPPLVEAAGSNIAHFSFDCPLPHRMVGGSGETIGYKEEVVFPWTMVPRDGALPVEAALSAFVGVCETVCIPVPVKEKLILQPVGQATRDAGLLAAWQARVPQPALTPLVTALAAGEDAGQVYLDVTLAAAVTDIFVEGKAMHFFATPVWRDEGLRARLPVHGARNADELKGSPLRITLDVGGAGLEQTLTVV